MNDNDSDSDDDDDMVEIDYYEYLNIEALDKFDMYDIAFENLLSQDQLRKIKEHMLVNSYLMLGIYIDLDLK